MRRPEYADRGELPAYESMIESPTDATVLWRDNPVVRTLSAPPRMWVGELIAEPPMTCRLLVEFSEVAEDVSTDAVRSISARRCLTIDRWSRFRMDGLCERGGGGGVKNFDLLGVTGGEEVESRTGGSYSSKRDIVAGVGVTAGRAGSSRSAGAWYSLLAGEPVCVADV